MPTAALCIAMKDHAYDDLREQLGTLTSEHESLVEVKVMLDMEIAAYRTLLETEEERLGRSKKRKRMCLEEEEEAVSSSFIIFLLLRKDYLLIKTHIPGTFDESLVNTIVSFLSRLSPPICLLDLLPNGFLLINSLLLKV